MTHDADTNIGAKSVEAEAAKPAGDAWTTRRLLAWVTDHFKKKEIDSPRLVAELLLGHVLKCERMRLYMEADRQASDAERETLRELVGRASKHEPVQYLVGEGWFFSRPYYVNKSTLIPRPSTETVVEQVLGWCRRRKEDGRPRETASVSDEFMNKSGGAVSMEVLKIADVGTGTGCIAISLAAQLPNGKILASDVSAEALELAKRNASRHKVDARIEFRQGDLLEPVRLWLKENNTQLDVLCSNPPYIPDAQWNDVPPNVKDHEPASALRGGADGLDYIKPLIAGAWELLRSGGLLALEIANVHGEAVMKLVEKTGVFGKARVVKDHEGHDRVLLAERK